MDQKTANFSVLTKLGILVAALFGYLLPSILFASSDWQTVTPSGATVFNTVKSMGDYVVLGTSSGVYVSSNNGQNWTQYVSGSNVLSVAIGWIVDQDTFTYTATSGTPVILGTSAGIYRGTLGGSSWTAASTGPTGAVNDLEFDQSQAIAGTRSQIYAATPQGVYRSDNLGVNWTLRNTGMTSGGNRQASKIVTNYGDSSIYVISNIGAATSTGEIYSSLMYAENSNTNESWTLANSADSTLKDISVVNASAPRTWLSKTNSIYESDGTNNWSDVSGDVSSISVRAVDSDYIEATIGYAATANGVWRTTNQALSSPEWLSIQGSLVDTNISFVNTNPASSTLVYALGASGVYKLSLLSIDEDITAPSTISNLSVSQDATNFQLQWTAPGDDGTYGTANNYEVRYSATTTIDSSNWDDTSVVSSISCSAPQVAGSSESCFFSKPSAEILTYYFAVKAVDEVGNESEASNVYSTLMQDIAVPTISAVASSTSATIATITWNTNENTDAQVNYGLTSSYTASSSLDTNLNNTHTITLTGLTNNTTYHFRVRSSDSSGNRTVSGDYTFTTIVSDVTAPVISAVTSSVGSSVITVTWTTNELATSQVDTGFNTSYAGQSTSDATLATSHSVTVGGLSDGTNYLYRIVTTDASGNTAYSTGSFTTTVAPIVATPVTTVPRGGGGGGGGRGGGYTRPVTTTTPTAVSGTVSPMVKSLVELLITLGLIAPDKVAMARSIIGGSTTSSTPAYTAPTYPVLGSKTLTKSLSIGIDDPEVVTLQKILNKNGYPVAFSGRGSLGNEISYFGYGTDTALKKFQCAYKIACAGQYGYGMVGPKTRTILLGLGY